MGCTRVQHNSHYNTAAGTTLTVSLTGVGSASAIALSSTWDTSSDTVTTGSSIADDLSASPTNIFHYHAGGSGLGQMSELWYYKNYGGGNRTWTLTTLSQVLRGIVVEEVSGADTTSPQQSSASANDQTGTSTTSNSGNVSPNPTLNGTYLWALSNSGTGTVTPTSPLVDLGNDGANSGSDAAAEVQSTAGAIAATFTVPASTWQCVAATFKPATTTPSPTLIQSENEARSRLRRQEQIMQARSRGNPWFFSSKYTPIRALGAPLKIVESFTFNRKHQEAHLRQHRRSFTYQNIPIRALGLKPNYWTEIVLNTHKHVEARKKQHSHTFQSKYTPPPPPPPPVTVPKIYNLFSYGRILDQKKQLLRTSEVTYVDQFFFVNSPVFGIKLSSSISLERAHNSRRWAHKRGPRSWHYIPPDIIPFLHWVPLEYEGIFLLNRAKTSRRWAHRRHPKYYYYWNHVIIPFIPTILPYDPAYPSTIRTTTHGSYVIWTKYKDRMKEIEPRR